MKENIKSEVRTLRENSSIAYVGSVNEERFPQIKAMLVLEHGNMKEHYFSTNTSSKRVRQFLENPKACIYFYRKGLIHYWGVMLKGEMESNCACYN